MKPQEAMVEYMKYKQSLFKLRKKYITKAVEKDMLSWDDKDALKVLKKLIKNLQDECYFLWAGVCPYCILMSVNCQECFYGKDRGPCHNTESVYRLYNRAEHSPFSHEKAIEILKRGLK